MNLAPQEVEMGSRGLDSLPLELEMETKSLPSLPLELLHRLLSHCSIPDVLSIAEALNRPELTEVIKIFNRNDKNTQSFWQVLKRPGLYLNQKK